MSYKKQRNKNKILSNPIIKMENEFDKLKEKFLSEISENKNIDDLRNFAREIRKKLYVIIEEYRKTDGRFDEKRFYLDQEMFEKIFGKIFIYSYENSKDQNLIKLRSLYNILMRYLNLIDNFNYVVKDFKEMKDKDRI